MAALGLPARAADAGLPPPLPPLAVQASSGTASRGSRWRSMWAAGARCSAWRASCSCPQRRRWWLMPRLDRTPWGWWVVPHGRGAGGRAGERHAARRALGRLRAQQVDVRRPSTHLLLSSPLCGPPFLQVAIPPPGQDSGLAAAASVLEDVIPFGEVGNPVLAQVGPPASGWLRHRPAAGCTQALCLAAQRSSGLNFHWQSCMPAPAADVVPPAPPRHAPRRSPSWPPWWAPRSPRRRRSERWRCLRRRMRRRRRRWRLTWR